DGIRDRNVTGVQTCALPIYESGNRARQPGLQPVAQLGESRAIAGPLRVGRLERRRQADDRRDVLRARAAFALVSTAVDEGHELRSEERRGGEWGRWGRAPGR